MSELLGKYFEALQERDEAWEQGRLSHEEWMATARRAEAAERERDEVKDELSAAQAALNLREKQYFKVRDERVKACKVAQSYKVEAHEAVVRAEKAERDRDAWKRECEERTSWIGTLQHKLAEKQGELTVAMYTSHRRQEKYREALRQRDTALAMGAEGLAQAWRKGAKAQGDADSFGMDATDDENPYLGVSDE